MCQTFLELNVSKFITISYFSTGILHEDLRAFLETNVPAKKKKVNSILGVGDSKLGSAISEESSLNVTCMHVGVVPEILRGKTISSY